MESKNKETFFINDGKVQVLAEKENDYGKAFVRYVSIEDFEPSSPEVFYGPPLHESPHHLIYDQNLPVISNVKAKQKRGKAWIVFCLVFLLLLVLLLFVLVRLF